MSKLHTKCPEEPSVEKVFHEKVLFSILFLDFEWKTGTFGEKIIKWWRICQKLIQDFQQSHTREIIFFAKNVIFFFPDFEPKNRGPVTKNIKRICRKCFFRVQKKYFGWGFWKKHNFFFSHFDWKVSAILKKMFSQKTFGVFGKQFRRVVLTAFYMSKRKFWGRDLVSNSYIFMTVFGFWTSCSALSVKSFLAGFSKLLFKCPKEHFAKW